MTNIRELYQELIIDHGRHPRNFRTPEYFTHSKDGLNPLCGDKVTIYLDIKDGLVVDVSFSGCGCAISTASASLMTQAVKGKSLKEIKVLFEKFHDLMLKKGDGDGLGKLSILSGVKEYPARVKCATLAWHTMVAAIDEDTQAITTE